MNESLENNVKAIVKFIEKLYSPEDVWVKHYVNPDRYAIVFYFNKIDDKYMTNPYHRNPEELKELMFNREIRTYINNFLGIKTSGSQPPDFYGPKENHPISIYTKQILSPKTSA